MRALLPQLCPGIASLLYNAHVRARCNRPFIALFPPVCSCTPQKNAQKKRARKTAPIYHAREHPPARACTFGPIPAPFWIRKRRRLRERLGLQIQFISLHNKRRCDLGYIYSQWRQRTSRIFYNEFIRYYQKWQAGGYQWEHCGLFMLFPVENLQQSEIIFLYF